MHPKYQSGPHGTTAGSEVSWAARYCGLTESASRRRGAVFKALCGSHASPRITSVTCNNVRMVTMEGCVNVVGVTGRYLGLEEPVKLIRGWVLLAVSFPRAHSRPLMCGPQSPKTGASEKREGPWRVERAYPRSGGRLLPGCRRRRGREFQPFGYPDLAHFSACTEISLHASR